MDLSLNPLLSNREAVRTFSPTHINGARQYKNFRDKLPRMAYAVEILPDAVSKGLGIEAWHHFAQSRRFQPMCND